MAKSKVYFVGANNLKPKTTLKLFAAGGMDKTIGKGDTVALKIHFGEAGNFTHIRPEVARKWVDAVKTREAYPFLTDTNTLYKHKRCNFFDHLQTAASHGFTMEAMGCPIIIADGFNHWATPVEVDPCLRLPTVKVAQAIHDADAMIVLTHVTLHHDIGFGGSIKNVGMGCVDKETKMRSHCTESAKVKYSEDKCIQCGTCVDLCPGGALTRDGEKIAYDREKCVACGDCVAYCPSGALRVGWGKQIGDVHKALLDSVKGTLSTFKPGHVLYVNVMWDVTVGCDCGASSMVFMPNLGVMVSSDILAVDKATCDLLRDTAGLPGTGLDAGQEKVSAVHKRINMDDFWTLCERAGVGNPDYDLITP